jgi:hypothetical protein
MAIKREIIIEVDDKGAIKAVDGLTDALNENAVASDNAADSSEAFEASIQKQQAQIKVLDGAVNLVGGSIETLAGGLVLAGAVTEDQAQAFEGAAIGAIAFADGTKRTIDGIVNLKEGLAVLTKGQKLATLATKAFGIAQKVAMGPVGIAIAAIGVITAAIVLLKDKFEIVNKVATFFGNIIGKVAQAIGLGATEAEKFASAQGELAKQTEFELQLLQAQGASTDELVAKERALLTQRKNAAKDEEERLEATQTLAIFEARVAKEAADREAAAAQKKKEEQEKAFLERKALREKEAEEIRKEEEKKAEEEAQRIADEKQKAIDDETDRLQSLADIALEFRRKAEDAVAADEVARLELQKQRQLEELDTLKATEEQKAQIIKFFNDQIAESNDKLAEEKKKKDDENNAKEVSDAKAVADAKFNAVMQSVDAIQSGLTSLFGESKAVAKANVLIDAAQASIGIFKSAQSIPAPFNAVFIAAQLAGLAASSAAAIREINSAQPGSSGGGGVVASARGAVNGLTGASIGSGPGPQLNGLGAPQVPTTEPIKAYVLAGDVTSAQGAETRLNQRRTL